MLKSIPILLIFFTTFLCPENAFSQEISPERKTEYTFTLNKIKHQHQVDGVINQTELQKNVSSCKLDWLNYKMVILVQEGGDNGAFSIEKIKEILINNNIALVKFTKKDMK